MRAATIDAVDEWVNDVIEHDGLIRRDVAITHGVDPDEIMKALRTGRLKRIQRGIYAWRQADVQPLALARAAVITCGVPNAVASHQTAARVHGIPIPVGLFPEHVTVSRAERRIRRRELVYHGGRMGLNDVEVREHVPITVVARTLIDLSDTLPQLESVWAIDDSLRRRIVDRETLVSGLASKTGGPGAAKARERIALADGKAESILETAGRLMLAARGVPLPEPQYEVFDRGRLIARLDGGYPEQKLGLEFDGTSVHGRQEAIFKDRVRQNNLHALGWTLMRFTWWDVMYATDQYVSSVLAGLAA